MMLNIKMEEVEILFFDYSSENIRSGFVIDRLFSWKYHMVAVSIHEKVRFLIAGKGIVTHSKAAVQRFMKYDSFILEIPDSNLDFYYNMCYDIYKYPVSRLTIARRAIGLGGINCSSLAGSLLSCQPNECRTPDVLYRTIDSFPKEQ